MKAGMVQKCKRRGEGGKGCGVQPGPVVIEFDEATLVSTAPSARWVLHLLFFLNNPVWHIFSVLRADDANHA